MAQASDTIRECQRILDKTGDSVVGEILRQTKGFVEWRHYPPDDAFDPVSHAQYYYHAHPPAGRPWREHGHFHLFLRRDGMPKAVRPAAGPDVAARKGNSDALCHLVAISMDFYGQPRRLFTTNRWVTGETWYRARDVVRCLDRFRVDVARPNWLVNRWLTAMVALFKPEIETLLAARDRVLDRWQGARPGHPALEDRALEVVSQAPISLNRRLAAIDAERRRR
jgi:hypothetical protein